MKKHLLMAPKAGLLITLFLSFSEIAVAGAVPGGADHAHHETEEQSPANPSTTKDMAKALYHDYCSVCHGDKGDGKSRAQQGLIPPPRDFTSKESAQILDRDYMVHVVTNGKPGTAMTGWTSRLDRKQIESIVDYIRDDFMGPDPAIHEEGRTIFKEYCSVCHGDTGKGAVWAQEGLNPPPINFATPSSKRNLTRERMIFSVSYGRPETAMTAWNKRLSADEIEKVVDYVRAEIMQLETAPAKTTEHDHHDDMMAKHDHNKHFGEDMVAPLPNGLKGNKDNGLALYEFNCSACHGSNGDGKGPRAYFIFPKPRNFGTPSAQAKYSRPHLFNSIATGSVGAEMPAWNKVFTDQEIADVAEYVYSAFIRPDASADNSADHR